MLNPPPNWPNGPLPTAYGPAEPAETGESRVFETDYSYETVPQRIGDTRKHRFFQIWRIGDTTGSPQQQTVNPAGLTSGNAQRIDASAKPDVWLVSISSAANTGKCDVYFEGEPGGPAVPLGAGGYAVIPARGNIMSLIGQGGANKTVGVVIALAGFSDSPPAPTISVGAY